MPELSLSTKKITILLVEDNPADRRLTHEVFKDTAICNEVYTVNDGEAAMDYLFKRGEFTSAPKPNLVLLDLNLPKKNGLEVLSEMKGNISLRSIPVIVLTTSKADEDIARSYDLHANAFISKPVNLDDFIQVIESLKQFWLSAVALPPVIRDGDL